MSIFKRRKAAPEGDDELVGTNKEELEELEPITGLYEDDGKPRINKKYKTAASWTGILKYTVLAAFFVYFMVMTLAYSSQINIENFRYIIKDMNFKLPVKAEDYGEIYYISDLEKSFALYRGDFVSIGRSRIDVIELSGKNIQSAEISCVKPRMSVSEKYLLVYDLSNNGFSVFNSFSLLYSETLDYPISCACINDKGYFLIVTKSAEYKSVVVIYNNDMKKVYQYNTNDGYVFDVLFDNDGNFLLYTVSAKGGGFVSRIVKGGVRSETREVIFEKNNTAFISAKRAEGDRVSVLCEDTIAFFDGGELLGEFDVYPRVCRKFEASDGYTAAVISTADTGSDSYLYVFDKNGELIHEEAATSDVQKIYVQNGAVYQLYTDRIRKTDLKTNKTYEHKTEYNAVALVFVDNEFVLLATPSRAYPISVYEDFKEVSD